MDKETKNTLLIVFGFVVVVFIIASPLLIKSYKTDKIIKQACEDRGLENCFYNNVICFDACNELDFTYLKYDSTGFGSSECWCYDNDKQPKQVY